ncbi:ABC transporter ATP-binding protein [Alcaligenaceae bacterium]|nr:ABC transporter ATP-binding protein [Alcaligenaceae bacterium]
MTDTILELKDVRKQFGKTEIIRGVDLAVKRGERLAVIGPNGAGKSTLFHLISGRLPISSGQIWFDGKQIDQQNAQNIYRSGLSRSFQITNLFHRQSVYENILSACMWSKGYHYTFWKRISQLKPLHERAQEVLELIGLESRRDVAVNLLTYAEQRALEIGIAVAGGSSTILLDEPTAGMSRGESDAAIELIRTVSTDKTLLMVEHDMGVVFGLADRVAVVVYGQVIACDTPEKIRANASVQEAYLGVSKDQQTEVQDGVA